MFRRERRTRHVLSREELAHETQRRPHPDHPHRQPAPPERLVELMFAKEEGREVGERVLAERVRESVREMVERQQAAG